MRFSGGSTSDPTYGTLAARPSASTQPSKTLYIATDDSGGTLYQVQSGAWVKIAAGVLETGGRELAYSERTTNAAVAVSANTDTAVPGLSISPVVGARPIVVEFFAELITHSVAASTTIIKLVEGATQISQANILLPTAGNGTFICARARLAPTAGSHTYSVQVRSGTAGTITIFASVSPGGTPAHLHAVEC